MPTLDMTDGIYRRIYSGFISHPKINALSWMAEAWFWRLVVLADDYGNHPANWRLLAVVASPVREVSADDARSMTLELVAQSLIVLYESEGQQYLHIAGFTKRQPANKNGRRIQRFPFSPTCTESESTPGNPGESKKIQDRPVGIRGNPVPPIPTPIPMPNPTPTSTPGESNSATEDGGVPGTLSLAERGQIRAGLVRIGVESGAAQQVSLHPNLTLALVKSTLAAVKKDKTIKSQPAVVLTRLRRELEMSE